MMDNIQDKELYELYFIVLLSKNYSNAESLYDMNIIWNNISKYYYLENNIYIGDQDVLYEWVKNKCRYILLNSLFLQVFDKFVNSENVLNKMDAFFISNILEMREIMLEYGKKIENVNNDIDKTMLSKMNKLEVIDMVKEILKEVDPSLEWLNIYETIISQNKIVYVDLLDESDRLMLEKMLGIDFKNGDINSYVFLNNKGEGHIILTYTGTIFDVAITIHEVIHYISRYKNNWCEEEPILREYSAIFYELYALEYLRRMGYCQREIAMINQDRLNGMTKLLDDGLYLTNYLIMLMEYGEIKEEYDFNDDKYDRADRCINDLVNNPYLLHDYYPYLMGNYLGVNSLKQLKKGNLSLFKMKNITDNLSKIDAYDVFKMIGYKTDNSVRKDDSLFMDNPKKKNKIKK